MDSLTQIILGAACGEAVAGRKIGNRAMLWGAVGGTIPDLDVFAGLFTDQITSTSFHRGFMHSFLFAALTPWLLAWLTRWFYDADFYRSKGYKSAIMLLLILLYVGAAAGINFIPIMMGEGLKWSVLLPTLVLGGWFGWKLWRDYVKLDFSAQSASYGIWVSLFFWSIFTHPVLDCFTSWGTQIFQPFSDYRVQWCTVSVVDPACTLPFMALLIIASRYARDHRYRSWWNTAGLVWFCGYLLVYNMYHKSVVNRAFKESLAAQKVDYKRIYTNPTIFNNIVWSGVAEGDTAYYFGQYGFNDCRKEFSPISVIPKNHHLLDQVPPDSRAGYFLRWFTDGYYNVLPYGGDTLQVNDLRFGLMGDRLTDRNYIFPILVFKNKQGEWDIFLNNRNKENMERNKSSIRELWKRVIHGRCE